MNTARNSATPASSSIHPIASCLRKLAIATATVLVAACATPTAPPPSRPTPATPSMQLRAVAFAELPGWNDDTQQEAWPSFNASCAALLARPARAATWGSACTAAASVDARDALAVRTYFEQHFSAYQVLAADGEAKGLITGYYEPLLHGSRVRDERNRYPLYAPPDDLLTVDLADLYPELKDKRVRARVDGKRVVPYWTRADIDAGRAMLGGKELLFVDDAVEAFFLQIQGSGRVELPDGSMVRVGYADQNGQPYRSIGRLLVERGELTLDQASMQGIKQWGRDHPEALPALLAENPSYVFFREAPPNPAATIDGPLGALGVPLAAGRAIAVDPRFIPLGAPVFVATTWPLSSRPLNRLMLAQDTGGAIRGPVRADWFWGFGDGAAQQAGRMKQDGRLWLLWPKGRPLPATLSAG
jgi:membrane-bound lytic murein transglycosylase A